MVRHGVRITKQERQQVGDLLPYMHFARLYAQSLRAMLSG